MLRMSMPSYVSKFQEFWKGTTLMEIFWHISKSIWLRIYGGHLISTLLFRKIAKINQRKNNELTKWPYSRNIWIKNHSEKETLVKYTKLDKRMENGVLLNNSTKIILRSSLKCMSKLLFIYYSRKILHSFHC